MKRRAVVAALGGIGLAGCVSGGPGAGESTSTPPATTSPPPGRTLQRRVSLASQDVVAEEHELRLNVEVLDPTVTADRTALIRVTTTNEGPPRSLSIGRSGCDLLNRSRGGSDTPAGLWLHSPDRTEHIDRVPGKWVADRPATQGRAYPAYGCTPTTYESGNSLSNEYELWDDYRVEGYLTPGTYRWEEDIQVWKDATDAFGDDPSATLTWGFSLSVETPS